MRLGASCIRGLPCPNSRASRYSRVSTFPRGGGSSVWFYTRCCETSGWRADCASVFFLPPLLLQKDLPHQASQGAVPVVSWPFSELGYLDGSFRDEASFLAFRRLFNFCMDKTPRVQLKVFSAQFCWHLGFALLRALSYKKDPGRLWFSNNLLRKLHLLPKAG